jgi:subtilisin family serine protease
MRFANFTAAVAFTAICGSAHAQIRLPLTLPATPLPAVSQSLDATGTRALDAASEWRHRQISRLVGDNKRLIETDPNGEPIVRSEVIAVGMSEAALVRARAGGFLVVRETNAAEVRLIVLETPEKSTTRNALRDLRTADPQGLYDYNHIYLGVGTSDSPDTEPPGASTHGAPASSGARIRVGLLDTGIDPTHPAFRDSLIHSWGCETHQVPAAHGTAVASLLVAHGGNELFAADVYCGSPTGGSVDAIVAALGWLSEQAVPVINVSLVGPRNILLERVVSALIARGHLIVAAVGNDGPAAPPLYPAAFPDVVGVTGVDAHRHVLIEAERGPQVMFAAQGADLEAASLSHGYVGVRGTSFAAPTVAALLAGFSSAPDRHAADSAIDALAKSAIHLGSAGRDLTYGFGLVGAR